MRGGRGVLIFFAVLIIGILERATVIDALTTFGKTNPQQNPPPPPTPVGKARECKQDSDCAGIQNTTCMSEPRDGRLRCLCGDYTAPVNGACTNKFKAIRALCNDDLECMDGAHCAPPTDNTPKRCLCKDGYVEENLMCNGVSTITGSVILLLSLTLVTGKFSIL